MLGNAGLYACEQTIVDALIRHLFLIDLAMTFLNRLSLISEKERQTVRYDACMRNVRRAIKN